MKHGSFYKNIFWQYGLQVLKYLFPLLLVPYLTRVLGTDTYAVYAYVLSFMGVMQVVADFGFTLSGTKKVVECRDNVWALSSLLGNITLARILLLAVLFAVTMGFSVVIPIMRENALYVVLAFMVVGLRALLPDFLFQGFERMGPLTTRYFASKGLQIVLTLLFVHSAEDLLLVAGADIVGSIVGLVWSFLASKRFFGVEIGAPNLRESLGELKESAIYCVSNVSSTLFSGFTTFIIGIALTNRNDVAFWSLTMTTVTAVQSLYNPIANALYPHLLTSKDYRLGKKVALLAAPALLIGTVAYCFLSEPIMMVLGGEEYLGASRVMVMISPLLPISFYGILVGWPILGTMGKVKELTATTVVTGVFNVLALLFLYFTGTVSLESLCLVRWLVDALLLGARTCVLWKTMSSSEYRELRVNERNA